MAALSLTNGYPSWLQVSSHSVSIRVRARPGSSRRGPLRADSDAVVFGLKSPPEKGRANDELIEVLARAASVPRSAIAIVRGAGNRDKLVVISTPNPASAADRLISLFASAKR